jgi:N-acetylglutamate synthase-like GNAT family acetyltransferase
MSGDSTSASALTVRDAEPRDRDAIRDLLTELGYPLETTMLARRLDRLAAEPSIRAFVALRDETVVGFASLHVLHLIERPPLGRLSAIVVTASERRAGIGLSLVERVEREARATGCDRLEVTSGEWREDAHAFYRARGFEETSKRFIEGL